jgi:hypothetical protein
MRKFITALLISVAVSGHSADLELKDNPPERYTVVKGDTLWDISGRFLKKPWRWPEIWQMNQDEIKNPHLIYPGDVIVLDISGATPSLKLVGRGKNGRETVKLSPTVRSEDISAKPVPSIPPADIEPFLSKPLVIEQHSLANAPRIVATQEDRVALGAGNTAYAMGLTSDKGNRWQVYRPGKALVDPDARQVLGYEAIYLGEARVIAFGEVSTIEIIKSTQEITSGDRLIVAPTPTFPTYVPHAPGQPVSGRIIAAYDGVAEVGQNAIVTINRGARDGIEVGHVLAVLRAGSVIQSPKGYGEPARNVKTAVRLPDERYGVVFVFRTFDRVSYALVMEIDRPVQILDLVRNP